MTKHLFNWIFGTLEAPFFNIPTTDSNSVLITNLCTVWTGNLKSRENHPQYCSISSTNHPQYQKKCANFSCLEYLAFYSYLDWVNNRWRIQNIFHFNFSPNNWNKILRKASPFMWKIQWACCHWLKCLIL